MKQKNKKEDSSASCILLGALGAILLGSLLSGNGIVRPGSGDKKGKVLVRAFYGKEWDF